MKDTMTKLLTHNGYSGTIEYDLESRCLFGKVLYINDLIVYQGVDLDELEQSFFSAVDDYLETCEETGKSPNKPFSGSFNVRVSPDLHKKLCIKAFKQGLTMNAAVSEAVFNYVRDKHAVENHTHTHIHKHAYTYCELGQEPLYTPEKASLRLVN